MRKFIVAAMVVLSGCNPTNPPGEPGIESGCIVYEDGSSSCGHDEGELEWDCEVHGNRVCGE